MVLAIERYRGASGLVDDATSLGLAWTSDERGALAVDLAAFVREWLARDAAADRPAVERYAVDDPYGEAALRGTVEGFFGTDVGVVVAGAGVNSLLHAVSRLVRGELLVVGAVYPDLPHWAATAGAAVRHVPAEAVDDPAGLDVADGSVVFLERPALLGATVGLAALEALCRRVGERGGVVVVDESNASYAPPASSAVTLVPRVDDLVVLRGMSKALGLGGLRVGLAIGSAAARERVLGCVPPLQASPASIGLARAVLTLGDIAAPLRERVAAHQREGTPLLAAVLASVPGGGPEPAPGGVPYWFVPLGDAPRRLAALGLVGKEHAHWVGAPGTGVVVRHRLSVPLAPDRFARFRALLSAGS